MANWIAIANQKGGVAKTTTAINLSAALAAADCRILLIDCDPQANATSGVGILPSDDRPSLYDVLIGTIQASDAILSTEFRGLSVLPSSRDLAGANVELANESDRAFRLQVTRAHIQDQYDFIILDCPPALDLLTLNALVAADSVLVPMHCEYFALEGISSLLQTVDSIRAELNPRLRVEGVLLTMYDARLSLTRQVADDLRAHFSSLVLETVIPRNVKLAEAPSHGKPILDYDIRSKGAQSYLGLARELLDRTRRKRSKTTANPENHDAQYNR